MNYKSDLLLNVLNHWLSRPVSSAVGVPLPLVHGSKEAAGQSSQFLEKTEADRHWDTLDTSAEKKSRLGIEWQ